MINNFLQTIRYNCTALIHRGHLYLPFAREYKRAPNIAMPDPTEPRKVMGVLKTITEARMMTTRFTVFVTACVTGATSLNIKICNI